MAQSRGLLGPPRAFQAAEVQNYVGSMEKGLRSL